MPREAPARERRRGRLRSLFPGLAESTPLLLFGALSVVLGFYLVLTHTAALGGRLPLWAYLWALGAIAIVGGIAASTMGEDLEGLPGEGDAVGDDLLVVRRSEWEELHAVAAAPPPPPPPRPQATLPRPAPPILAASPVRRPPKPRSAPPDWWESALELAETGVLPDAVATASEVDGVLETLDSIEREATPPILSPASRATEPPAPPKRAVSRPRPAPVPRSVAPPAPASIDQQIDAIDRDLDELLVPPGASAPPIPPADDSTCIGCRRPLDAEIVPQRCDSCNRAVCPDCVARSQEGKHPGLCPICAMLLDGALGNG